VTILPRHGRNFPKPPLAVVYEDCGLSERTAVVTRLCERTDELSEFMLGHETRKLLKPAQSNVDERMPLTYLRPCIDSINAIIFAHELPVEKLEKPGDSMDYHGFVPLARRIAEKLNEITGLL
jgi:hypothetical protein